MRITPGCPLRNTSASPSMTRAITPHPALQSGQMLGFHVDTPGTRSSSGMKRMIWFSGFPHAVSAAVVPEIAVSLMKWRRSMGSVVASQTVVRRLLALVTVDAKRHVHVDHPLRDGLGRLIAVARRTLDLRAYVR